MQRLWRERQLRFRKSCAQERGLSIPAPVEMSVCVLQSRQSTSKNHSRRKKVEMLTGGFDKVFWLNYSNHSFVPVRRDVCVTYIWTTKRTEVRATDV